MMGRSGWGCAAAFCIALGANLVAARAGYWVTVAGGLILGLSTYCAVEAALAGARTECKGRTQRIAEAADRNFDAILGRRRRR